MVGWTNHLGRKRSMIYAMSLLTILYAFLVMFFPIQPLYIVITRFIGLLLTTWRNMILFIMVNSFPLHGLSGMFITIMYSLNNFGTLKAINTKIISVFGWVECSSVGLVVQILIILGLGKMYSWIEEGVVTIEEPEGEGEKVGLMK